jgi:hypothetical protein
VQSQVETFALLTARYTQTSLACACDPTRVAQNAGWVPVVGTLSVVCVASASCATLLADAMARIPGNDQFQVSTSPRISYNFNQICSAYTQ